MADMCDSYDEIVYNYVHGVLTTEYAYEQGLVDCYGVERPEVIYGMENEPLVQY